MAHAMAPPSKLLKKIIVTYLDYIVYLYFAIAQCRTTPKTSLPGTHKKAGIKPGNLHQPLASTSHEDTFSQRCSNSNAGGRILRFACEFFASGKCYSLDFWKLCFGGVSFRLFPNRLSLYQASD
jgi:hypothetical protein